MIWLLCNKSILVIIAIVYAKSNLVLSEYITPIKSDESSETYIFKDKEYTLNYNAATWLEAYYMCKYSNESLAILDDYYKAKFIANILSISNFAIHGAWIGADRQEPSDPDGYHWLTGSHFPRPGTAWNSDGDARQEIENFPSWVNRTMVPVPEKGANCVAVDRAYHNKPIFIDLVCSLKRPFICQKDVSVTSYFSRQVTSVNCPNHKYHVFKGHYTWDDAAGYCARFGMSLATVDNHECAQLLGKQLMRARPSIENAWIGGRGQKYKWKWLHTGESIMKNSESKFKINHTWPPFAQDVDFQEEGCLLIDRHVCNKPVFIQDKCDRKKDFVCMEEVTDLDNLLNLQIKASNEDLVKDYVIQKPMSWYNAYEECTLSGGYLPSVLDSNIITKVLLYMGEKDEMLQHVWVAGKLNCEVYNDKEICEWFDPYARTVITDGRETTSNCRPWCDGYNSPEYGCLNLDRENHLQGLLYGMPCDTPQHSLCLLDYVYKSGRRNTETGIELSNNGEDEIVDDHVDESDNNLSEELPVAGGQPKNVDEYISTYIDQHKKNLTIEHNYDNETVNSEEDKTHREDDEKDSIDEKIKDDSTVTIHDNHTSNKTDRSNATDGDTTHHIVARSSRGLNKNSIS